MVSTQFIGSVLNIRTAKMEDALSIEALIALSARGLATDDYSDQQIEGALKTAWGLDTQLIRDQTYFVVEKDGAIVACGGWSYRKTLFGNDTEATRDPEIMDPGSSAAKIRAFFVDPKFARQGIGSMIMLHCENSAFEMGYRHLELMATLPGLRLYKKHGFSAGKAQEYAICTKLSITFVPMTKTL